LLHGGQFGLLHGGQFGLARWGQIQQSFPVDERVLDENGKLDALKVVPLVFDPFNNEYLKVGEKIGKAFSDGKQLREKKR